MPEVEIIFTNEFGRTCSEFVSKDLARVLIQAGIAEEA